MPTSHHHTGNTATGHCRTHKIIPSDYPKSPEIPTYFTPISWGTCKAPQTSSLNIGHSTPQ